MNDSETQAAIAAYHRLLTMRRFQGDPETLEDYGEALRAYKVVASDLAVALQFHRRP